jgi:hypothetical protein
MKKQLFTITGYRDELFTRELPLIEGYLRFKSTRRELHVSMTLEKAREIVQKAKKPWAHETA